MVTLKTTATLVQRLRGILLRQRLVLFLAGLVTTIAAVIVTGLVISLLANLMVLPVWLKLPLMIAAGLAGLYFFSRYAVARLFHGSVDSVALALEKQNHDLKGRLIAAVQFSRIRPASSYSNELVKVTEQQALQKARLINFNEVLSFHPVLQTVRQLAGPAILALALLLIAPGMFDYAFEVYSHPTTRVAPPVAYKVYTSPSSCEWIKYRDIKIGGAVVGVRLPEKAYIHHRMAGGNWQKTKVDLEAVDRTTTETGDSLYFGITMRQINKSFDFYISAGELRTEVQRIDVVDRPRVTGIRLSIFYPEYTGLSPVTIDENNGSFSAVIGSRVNMKIRTNLPVEKAEMVFEDDSRTPLTVDGRTVEVGLVVDQSRAYRFELLDHLGETNPDPIEYYLIAVPDEYPSIDVVRPGYDVNLNDEMVLPLIVRIFDDYGFTSLVMKYTVVSQGRTSEEHVAVLHFSDKIETQGDIEFNWDMESLNLFPGDHVTYFFEVADNDMVSGPKVSSSRQYVARLPSLDEIMAQVEGESLQRINRTEEVISTGKELARRLKEAARKLDAQNANGEKADWQQQKELDAIAEKNQELIQKVEKLAENMEQSLEHMQENALLSRQIMEKLAQIQKLFEEVASPEMREAQKQLLETLQKMNREELRKAMDDFQVSQEEMLQRLERTLSLLKKMQVVQKMEAMVRKLEELAERQNEMNENTASAEKESLPNLSGTEDDLTERLQQLKQEVAQLREQMTKAEMDNMAPAQKFAEALEQTDADQNMKQMSQELQKQQRDDAQSQGRQAYSKMMETLDQMQQQLAALTGGDEDEIEKAMRRAIEHCNNISQDQEALLREAQQISPRSVVIRDLAANQQALSRSCSGLKQTIGELGEKSPFVAAELQSLVGTAMQSMDAAVNELDSKQGTSAIRCQREAMFNLNKAAIRLMESLDEQKNCKNAKNCNKPMSELEMLCKKQNQCNKQTQSICNKPRAGQDGKPSPNPESEQYRSGLQRMAGEQGAIRKSLEQLEREFAGSRQVLGRLSDIAREMKEVEEALMEGEVAPETTERQLRIYSRMLEASRSLQRKDFSEKRRANTATDNQIYVPPELSKDFFDDNVELEDRLRRFLGDSYPLQYEEQIKAYFRALLKASMQMQEINQSGPAK